MPITTKGKQFFTRPGAMQICAAPVLCIAWMISLALPSCGDFTIFPDPNNPGPGPEPTQLTCDKVFAGLGNYNAKQDEQVVDATLTDALAVAVVPKGMSFSFTDSDTAQNVAASAGDLMAADRTLGKLFLYSASEDNQRYTYPAADFSEAGGVCFYYEEAGIGGSSAKIMLMAYTGRDLSNGDRYTLFVKDFTTGSLKKMAQNTNPSYGFSNPTAVAIGAGSGNRGIFLVDNSGKDVVRVSLKFEGSAEPKFDTARKIESGGRIQSVAFFNQNLALYFSDWGPNGIDPKVYKVDNALTSGSPSKGVFVGSNLLQTVGLALAFTEQKATTADLLVGNRQLLHAVQAFDADGDGKQAAGSLEIYNPEYLQAVAYDCTSGRIVYTRLKGTVRVGIFEVPKR